MFDVKLQQAERTIFNLSSHFEILDRNKSVTSAGLSEKQSTFVSTKKIESKVSAAF